MVCELYLNRVIIKKKQTNTRQLPLGILPLYEIKSNSYLYPHLLSGYTGAPFERSEASPEPQDVLILSPFWPHHAQKPGQDEKRNLSHLLEGRECHPMLDSKTARNASGKKHSTKQVRIIFKQLGLGTQVLSDNSH